jgi:hypothetical protein
MGITVITPSIPERLRMLTDAIESVQVQTVPVEAHLIRVQRPPEGELSPVHTAVQLNALLAAVDTEWTAPLCDDDIYLRQHIEKIQPHLAQDVDVVYSFPRDEHETNRIDVSDWAPEQVARRLEEHNFIRSTITIRTELLHRIGGWAVEHEDGTFGETGVDWEDYDLLIRLARAGGRFRCVPEETWVYRVGNWRRILSWGGEVTSTFRVLGARYGIKGAFVDVTSRVALYVADGALEFQAGNDSLGGDPAENHVKQFHITYSVDGEVKERMFLEDDWVRLP